MPYDPDNPKGWPSGVKALHREDAEKARQWVHVFNSVYKDTKDEGRAMAAAYTKVPEARSKAKKMFSVQDGIAILKEV